MLALVVMDHVLRHRAQNGDVAWARPPIAGTIPGSAAASTPAEHPGAVPPDGRG
jgi:hypothetical protein